jgi:chromosome partitioning protein
VRPLASRNLHRRIDDIAWEFSHVVIDTPPEATDIVASAALAADRVLIPVALAPTDLAALHDTLRLLRQIAAIRPTRVSVLLGRVPADGPGGRSPRRLASFDAELLAARVPLLERAGLSAGFSGPAAAFGPVVEELLRDGSAVQARATFLADAGTGGLRP